MDPVSLPISVVVSLVSALLTVGAVYGITTSKLASVRKDLDDALESLAKVARDLNISEKEAIKLEGQVMLIKQSTMELTSLLEELKASTVTQGVFEAWMRGQNQTLDHIVKRLDGGARTVSQQVRTTDTRIDIESERPYDPGPMRPKLPSVTRR